MSIVRYFTALIALIVFWCWPKMCLGDAVSTEKTFLLGGAVPLQMAWIPAGTFFMGSSADEQDAQKDEMPQHPVTLSHGCWLGKHEVTQAQWKAVMESSPWKGRANVQEDENAPAVYVSWDDANAFVVKLREVTGREFRLPTEAEWEYACRAGTDTRFSWGDDEDYTEIDLHAWWRGTVLITESRHARPVGLKYPSPWDLYDMNGNVFEWCQDWYGPYAGEPAMDSTGAQSGAMRVNRGGSWITIGGNCRSARRGHDEAAAAHEDLGFRLACSAAPQSAAALEAGAPETCDVFVGGQGGVNTYRIPALLVAPDTSLLAFCEARKESIEDASPTDLVMRQSIDGGRTWRPTQILVRGDGKEAVMNPCAVVDHTTNTIFLFCIKAHQGGQDYHGHVLLMSKDSGKTWDGPIDLSLRIVNYDATLVFGPGVGIQMKSGRLVVPGYSGVFDDATQSGYFSRVLYSIDHGERWTLGARVPEFSDESQAVELCDGRLMLNMRGDMGKGCRGVALSDDGGETWSDFRWDAGLNECPCQASILRYSFADQDGKSILLFANPDNRGEKYGVVERTRMCVRLSHDDGKTWPIKRLIHPGPSSYSSLVRLPNGNVGLLYEGGQAHRREWIRFVRFSLSWLTTKAE